jgi:hypothetical protein
MARPSHGYYLFELPHGWQGRPTDITCLNCPTDGKAVPRMLLVCVAPRMARPSHGYYLFVLPHGWQGRPTDITCLNCPTDGKAVPRMLLVCVAPRMARPSHGYYLFELPHGWQGRPTDITCFELPHGWQGRPTDVTCLCCPTDGKAVPRMLLVCWRSKIGNWMCRGRYRNRNRKDDGMTEQTQYVLAQRRREILYILLIFCS